MTNRPGPTTSLGARPADSLRTKLVRSAALLIGTVGLIIGVIVGIIQLYVAQKAAHQLRAEIERTMIARGASLAVSHADVFRSFVRDTALTEVQHTLSLTVQQEDVVYGVFTDSDGRPWAYCSPSMPCSPRQGFDRLQMIEPDQLVADLHLELPLLPTEHSEERRISAFGRRIIEFAEPVHVDGRAAGMLRYGISSHKLEEALEKASAQRQSQSVITLIAIAAVVIAAIFLASALARSLAFKITRPLEELTLAAEALAHGDLNTSVSIRSDDELEVLGNAFNSMVRDLRVSYSVLEENNQELAREIEERRRAQAERTELQNHLIQSQKMEAFGQLAGGVAHDFNNILAVIVGNSELLGELLEGAQVEKDLLSFNQVIQDAAEKGANLTRQLLTFARKETDNPRAVDVNELLLGFEKLIRRLVEEHITISFDRAPHVPKIYADAGRVEQVLMNLCVNARDAMPGGGSLTVRTRDLVLEHSLSATTGLVPKGHYLLIEAEDTGTGMNPEVMGRVFEPFYTTKPAGRGTGLGLATAHGIIRSAGGAIEIDSELGRGTVFRIYLPAYESEDADDPRKSTRDIPKGAGQLVLLCEDEETVRAMTEHMLRRAAYQVISVAGPHQALQVLQASQVDLLITDVIMPEMDGSQLATQARVRHPRLPVLFVSGYTAGVLSAQELEENGPNFLRKPYRARELLERVHNLLHRDSQAQSTTELS